MGFATVLSNNYASHLNERMFMVEASIHSALFHLFLKWPKDVLILISSNRKGEKLYFRPVTIGNYISKHKNNCSAICAIRQNLKCI